MKIAIPVENNTSNANVSLSFGRTPYFLLHDTETEEDSFLDNSAVANQGGAGIKAAQTIVDNNAEILITPRCGENAAEVLKAAGLKIYQSQEGDFKENIVMFKEGRLELLKDIHPGLHNHGNQ